MSKWSTSRSRRSSGTSPTSRTATRRWIPRRLRKSEPVPTDFLKRFYRDAYERIRIAAPDVTVVFHDGFRIKEWKGYSHRPDFENVVLDTHLYLMMLPKVAGDRELASTSRSSRNTSPATCARPLRTSR